MQSNTPENTPHQDEWDELEHRYRNRAMYLAYVKVTEEALADVEQRLSKLMKDKESLDRTIAMLEKLGKTLPF